MKGAVQIGNAYFPYKNTTINGKKYFQIKLKIGTYPNGRDKFKTISATTKEELAVKTKTVLEKNEIVNFDKTICQIANEWLASKFNIVAPSTYDKVESVVRVHIVPDIGHEPVDALKESFLQNYINELALKGNQKENSGKKGLSYNSLRKIHSVLSEICDYACRKDYIDKSYMKYVSIPKYVNKPKEKRILDDTQLAMFMDELNRKNEKGEYNYYYRTVIIFMLLTGLRPCEAFALEKDRVDFEKKFIRIERNRIRIKNRSSTGKATGGYTTKICDDTKNESSRRIVPLTDEAFDILMTSCKSSKSKLCFPNQQGKVVNPNTFAHNFEKICKRAMVDITPHSLRHTFASNVYYNSKLDISKLARLLGHSTPKVTYDTYIHQIEAKEMLVANELANIYH
ncbi:MAG: site-specific integrase [Eubacterium sp.]|nr:site-specific integrase [Eubacterium sp.]